MRAVRKRVLPKSALEAQRNRSWFGRACFREVASEKIEVSLRIRLVDKICGQHIDVCHDPW